MTNDPLKDLIEWIRNKLNSLPEKDIQGNNNRVGWQLLTYLVGSAAEESTDPTIRKLGTAARKGAKKSFSDFVAIKFFDWLANPSTNNPYLQTKTCPNCKNWLSFSNSCPYCFSEFA